LRLGLSLHWRRSDTGNWKTLGKYKVYVLDQQFEPVRSGLPASSASVAPD